MPTNAQPIIQVRDVTKIFDGRTVLDAIRLDVLAGETLVILGGSGSGKSTLLRLMIGNVRPDGGDIVRLRQKPVRHERRPRSTYRKSRRRAVSERGAVQFDDRGGQRRPAAARTHRSCRKRPSRSW